MTTLQAAGGTLVFSGRTAILARHPVRAKATGLAALTGLVDQSFSAATATARFSAPVVKSSVSVGRKDFKQVR